jgi:dihydroorotase
MMEEGRTPYDLLLKGGYVIDPANSINELMDVAIRGDHIAAVAKSIPVEESQKVVDVSGRYVTPGLIDIHVHILPVFEGSVTSDLIALRSGVTTVVDAGSSGCKNFEEAKTSIIDKSKTRVLALLNIASCGMCLGEQKLTEMDAVAAAEMIARYPDILVGIKSAHYMGAGFESIDHAVHAGRLSHTLVMVDFGVKATASYEDLLLKHLRPGDIHTHFYARHFPLLNDDGKVQDYVWKARERGVIFDVGHGAGSFWFHRAVPAVNQGFVPDSISTDQHAFSLLLIDATMPTVMSKFLNMGMTLEEVIKRSTVNPAREIQRPELGTLSVGAGADVTVLERRKGEFGFVDCGRNSMRGDYRLECQMTIRNGKILWDVNGISCPDWEKSGD